MKVNWALAIVLLFCRLVNAALAAEPKETETRLSLNQSVEREIALGATNSFTIQLNAADYVAGWVEQRGIAVLADVFSPDGARLREFPGRHEGKREFAFIAETAGLYRLQLRSPTSSEAARSGELLLFW
jgi:hypothetical protein